jgi:hypothetical protein
MNIRYKDHILGMFQDGTKERVGSEEFKFGPFIFPIFLSLGTVFEPREEKSSECVYEGFPAGTLHLSNRIPIPSGFSESVRNRSHFFLCPGPPAPAYERFPPDQEKKRCILIRR